MLVSMPVAPVAVAVRPRGLAVAVLPVLPRVPQRQRRLTCGKGGSVGWRAARRAWPCQSRRGRRGRVAVAVLATSVVHVTLAKAVAVEPVVRLGSKEAAIAVATSSGSLASRRRPCSPCPPRGSCTGSVQSGAVWIP